MGITVRKLSDDEFHSLQIVSWPIWRKEVSEFEWYYDSTESCLILEGDVIVTDTDGVSVHFGAGDFVVFPKGLACTWKIIKPVKKHYMFE